MSTTVTTFSQVSFIKARLFGSPVYRADDESDWTALRNNLDDIRHYFRQVGQELVFDEGEGYAFIRQMEALEGERVPRLVQSRPLNYETTLLLVFLREELDRFELSGTDSARLVLSREQLHALIEPYVQDSNDKVRDRQKIDRAVDYAAKLGFLRREGRDEIEEFQVMRIVKARIGAQELESIKDRLLRHAQSSTQS